MANINYKNVSYFETRPDIVRLFDDLDKFRNFCRFEMLPFNEADMYNRANYAWNQFYYANRPQRPRGEYSREGSNNRNNDNRSAGRTFQRR